MTYKSIEVELAGCGSLVRGYGSRALIEEVTGRPPIWIPRLRGWSCQERTATKVIALATERHYDVDMVGPRTRRQRMQDILNAAPMPVWPPVEQPDSGEGGRW